MRTSFGVEFPFVSFSSLGFPYVKLDCPGLSWTYVFLVTNVQPLRFHDPNAPSFEFFEFYGPLTSFNRSCASEQTCPPFSSIRLSVVRVRTTNFTANASVIVGLVERMRLVSAPPHAIRIYFFFASTSTPRVLERQLAPLLFSLKRAFPCFFLRNFVLKRSLPRSSPARFRLSHVFF